MSDLVGYRPVRVSVRLLREHLRTAGSASTAALHAVVRASDPRVTEEQVRSTLAAHPRVFVDAGVDGWQLKELDETRVVVRRRPVRPHRQSPPPGQSRAAAPAQSAPPPPTPGKEWSVRADGTPVVVVAAGDVLDASGRRLLLRIPVPAAEHLAALQDHGVGRVVEVYERVAGTDEAVFRGRRAVVDLVPSGRDTHLVVGRSAGLDWGALARPAVAELTAPANDPKQLMPSRTFWDLSRPVLAGAAAQCAALPPAGTRTPPHDVLAEAQRRLVQVRDRRSEWEAFANWVGEHKPRWQQELTEDVLRLALASVDDLGVQVAQLAVELLGDTAPLGAAYAELLAATVVAIPGDRATKYAQALLRRCRDAGVDSVDVDLSAAKLALTQDRSEDACRIYRRLQAAGILPADAVEDFLLAAADCTGFVQDALGAVDQLLASVEDPAERAGLAGVLGAALEVAHGRGDRQAAFLAATVQTLLASGCEEPARHRYETWRGDIRPSAQLDVLSLFEDAELAATAEWLLPTLQSVVAAASRSTNVDLLARAVHQLELVEHLCGLASCPFSRAYADDLRHRQPIVGPPAQDCPFAGVTLTIVGGNPRRRDRLRMALEERGAGPVHQVAPHWEAYVDREVMSAQLVDGAVAVLLTDEVGHQEQALLRNRGVRIVFTQGGPSRVLRELENQLLRAG